MFTGMTVQFDPVRTRGKLESLRVQAAAAVFQRAVGTDRVITQLARQCLDAHTYRRLAAPGSKASGNLEAPIQLTRPVGQIEPRVDMVCQHNKIPMQSLAPTHMAVDLQSATEHGKLEWLQLDPAEIARRHPG